MTFLTPLFLLGGLALTLPLWLHLLHRQNPIRLPFSSLMFFERRQQSSLKERRLRYLLLLAARLLLYLLLALAFALLMHIIMFAPSTLIAVLVLPREGIKVFRRTEPISMEDGEPHV